ncbi:MAG: hypothetical protein AABY47_03260 [Pseudomonadota bacterium]
MIFTIPAHMAQTLALLHLDSSSRDWDENGTAIAAMVKPSANPRQSRGFAGY